MQQGCILYDKLVSAIKENVIPNVLDYRKARKKKENKWITKILNN